MLGVGNLHFYVAPHTCSIYLAYFDLSLGMRRFAMLLKDYWNGDSSYAPVCSSRDLLVHVYHVDEDEVDYDSSLRDILGGAGCPGSRFIFEAASYGLFCLWTTSSRTTSANTPDDALIISQKFVQRSNQQHICISFNDPEKEKKDGSDTETGSILVVLTRYDRELPSLGIPLVLQEKMEKHWNAKNAGLKKTLISNRFFHILCVVVSIFIVLIFSAKYFKAAHSPDMLHSWIQYDTRRSIGPRYQLPVNGQNVSQLTSILNHGDWALRVDDQAIIPLHLLDDEEQHYQEWFQNRYPEVNQIRLNQSYINETWLNSPLINQVPVDDMFHFSHCVLAIKRYIKAKETGRHVCGRDLDHEHMKHCLDALDWWAFPDPGGKPGDTVPNPKHDFWWRTKICFD